MDDKPKKSRNEAANYLTSHGFKISALTLAKMATVGGGPTFYKFGRRVFYDTSDLDLWVEERISAPRRSTSEVAA